MLDPERSCPDHGKTMQRLNLQSVDIYACIWSQCDYREREETDMLEEHDPMGWWVIGGTELLSLLRRAHGGEDPETLIVEEYANAEVSKPDGGSTGDGGSTSD